MKTSFPTSIAINHALKSAVADLETVNPWVGLGRFLSLGILFFSFVGLAWSAPNLLLMAGYSVVAGVFYAFWLICTHDAAHHTLTGWKWFDEGMSRLISYPMAWTYGTYAQIHRSHHAWNGIDLRDPERVQWTASEYEQAKPWQQWYIRHQWSVDLLVLGGIGLIAKTTWKGLHLRHQNPVLQRALLLDWVGILLVQMGLVVIAVAHDRLLHYFLFWFILERTIGCIMQARDHLEHYGMWGTSKGHLLTQLYACRNLTTPPFVSWLMGGLPDHAIHHAFPNIPFNHLPEAFDRVQVVLAQHQLPALSRGTGYIQEILRLAAEPVLIGTEAAHHPVEHPLSVSTGRHK